MSTDPETIAAAGERLRAAARSISNESPLVATYLRDEILQEVNEARRHLEAAINLAQVVRRDNDTETP